jgi:hypothetical protein
MRSQNTTWKDFITSHMSVLAGTDFFTVGVIASANPLTADKVQLGRYLWKA